MRVFGKCNKCNTEIGFSTYSSTRVEFAMNEGELKTLSCKKCHYQNIFHVDEIYTKASKIALFIAGLSFIIGTFIALFFIIPTLSKSSNSNVTYVIGGLLLVPGSIYGLIQKQERDRVNAFNRHKLKG